MSQRTTEATTPRSTAPLGNPALTGDELQAVRDVKVGKPIAPELQARLTQLKLAAARPGGFSLTNEGELRLVHAKSVVRKRF